jgi:hypothetical protein
LSSTSEVKSIFSAYRGFPKYLLVVIGLWMFLVLSYYSFIMIHDRIVSAQDWACLEQCDAQEASCLCKCNMVDEKKFRYSGRAIENGLPAMSAFALIVTRNPLGLLLILDNGKDLLAIIDVLLLFLFLLLIFFKRKQISLFQQFLGITILVSFIIMNLLDIFTASLLSRQFNNAPEYIETAVGLLVGAWLSRGFMPILAGLFALWNLAWLKHLVVSRKK